MSSWAERMQGTWRCAAAALVLSLSAAGALAQPAQFPGIGRDATPAEVKAWDIDVRPDFQGLPPGSGSVDKGQQVWEDKCASCHGVFGESNSVFNPLVGGTGKADIASGRVANLQRNDYPGRTTMMKVPTVVHAVGLHQPRDAMGPRPSRCRWRRCTRSPPTCSTWPTWCPPTSRCRTATSAKCSSACPTATA